MWRSITIFTAVVLVGLAFLGYLFGYIVKPGYMGVRQIAFGPYQGFSEKGLPPGYHWSVPFYSRIHFVPVTIQLMDFDRDEGGEGASKHEDSSLKRLPHLEVQTTNGQSMFVDLSLMYRFYEESAPDHGGPRDLITKVGTEEVEWHNRVITVVENELKKTLGRLSTSEFYNPYLRQKEVDTAEKNMDERLSVLGIKIEAVLLRRYTYAAVDIDEAIYQKNLTVLAEQVNAAASKLEEVRAQVSQVASSGDAAVKTLLVEGENQARVIRSRADLYESLKQSEGNLVVAQAKAESDRLKAGAMASASGAQSYVAIEMAPIIKSLKGGVIADIDPFNVDSWLRNFGVQREAKQ